MDNILKESVKLIKKSQHRLAIVQLDRYRNTHKVTMIEDIQLLRRICYSINKVLTQYRRRNDQLISKSELVIIRKQYVYLEQWHDHLKRGCRHKKQPMHQSGSNCYNGDVQLHDSQQYSPISKRRLEDYLLELMKFSQVQALKYQKYNPELSYTFANTSSTISTHINQLTLQTWKYSVKVLWNNIILGNICMGKQLYTQASIHLEANIPLVQYIFNQLIHYKILKRYTELDMMPLIVKHLQLLFHTFHILALSYLLNDKYNEYYSVLKLAHSLTHKYNYLNSQITELKALFTSNHKQIKQYLLEISEMQRIVSLLYTKSTTKDSIISNPVDEYFYDKYKHQQLNQMQVIRLPTMPSVTSSTHIPINKFTIRKTTPPMRKQQTSPAQVSPPAHKQKTIKQESYSYIRPKEENLKYYLNKQISASLQKDSFFSYNDVTKDIDTNISLDSQDSAQRKSSKSTLKTKGQASPEGRVPVNTRNAIYNRLESKALYFVEVERANLRLTQVRHNRDLQQKKQISDKLISEMKTIQREATLADPLSPIKQTKSAAKIYREVYDGLRTMVDEYSRPSTTHKPKLSTQQSSMILLQNDLAQSVMKKLN